MSPEKQREVIGELMGWKRHADGIGWYKGAHPRIHGGVMLPDYLNSLDAMHEAEKILKWVPNDEYCQASDYYEHLVFICGDKQENPDVYEWHLITATAAQRAEAFLKTLGLWGEDK